MRDSAGPMRFLPCRRSPDTTRESPARGCVRFFRAAVGSVRGLAHPAAATSARCSRLEGRRLGEREPAGSRFGCVEPEPSTQESAICSSEASHVSSLDPPWTVCVC
jgi:hypothetical protein